MQEKARHTHAGLPMNTNLTLRKAPLFDEGTNPLGRHCAVKQVDDRRILQSDFLCRGESGRAESCDTNEETFSIESNEPAVGIANL